MNPTSDPTTVAVNPDDAAMHVKNALLGRIEHCEYIMAQNSLAATSALWAICLDAHKGIVVRSLDPMAPAFPPFPFQDQDGNWIAPVP